MVFSIATLISWSIVAYGHGVHRRDLHADLAAHLGVNALEVEAHDGGELVVEVVVACHACGLDPLVVAELHLLAGLADLVGDEFGERAALDLNGLELIDALALVGEGEREHLACERAEGLVLSDEVCLALQRRDSGEIAVRAREYATLGGVAVLTLGGNRLAFLTDYLDGGLDVSFGLRQGVLAVHHAGAGHVAQLLDVFYTYSHCLCS